VVVTPDGTRVVSASSDRTLKVWDLESGRELRTLENHSAEVSSVAVTPEGRRAVSASNDHTLRVWDLQSGEALAAFGGEVSMTACAVGPNGMIVAGDGGGRVYFLRLEGL
jgi:WD40 repeat protein